jgi:hypothetical protein
MIKKIITLFALQLTLSISLLGQTIVYKCNLKVYPESNNKNACVLSIDEIHQEFDINNNIKYNFNIQSFLPAMDAESIFETVRQKDWSITFLHKQVNEKLQAEILPKEEMLINIECVFNGMIIPLDVPLNKKKNKDKTFYNELSFSLTGHQIGANSEELFLFTMKLTPQ